MVLGDKILFSNALGTNIITTHQPPPSGDLFRSEQKVFPDNVKSLTNT